MTWSGPRRRLTLALGPLRVRAADAVPGAMPGTAVRSIAAEGYRLARDRGASFGRRKEEACVPNASRRRSGERLTGEYGGCFAGRPANVAQGVKFSSANAKSASGALVRNSG